MSRSVLETPVPHRVMRNRQHEYGCGVTDVFSRPVDLDLRMVRYFLALAASRPVSRAAR